jgi:hypothetical protein
MEAVSKPKRLASSAKRSFPLRDQGLALIGRTVENAGLSAVGYLQFWRCQLVAPHGFLSIDTTSAHTADSKSI